jgi:hypothetical protein
MILSFTLVFAALAILFFLLYLEGGRNASVRLEDLAQHTRPVDIDAFRNLVDPKEEAYLRANLLPTEFRTIQRERMGAAMVTSGAALIMRLSCCAWGKMPPGAATLESRRQAGSWSRAPCDSASPHCCP